MSERPITPAEYFAVLNAPARRNPERSWAKPQERYRDPALSVKFEREQKGKINRCNSAISLVEYGKVGGSSTGETMLLTAKLGFPSVAGLRRVRRDEVRAPTFVKPDGLDLCLSCWKEWMSRDDTDLGIKNQSTLRGEGDGYGTVDTSQMRRDNEIAEATDAMVRSLKSSHQWAMRRKCGITRGNVWNFHQLDYVAEAQDACVELEKKLRTNIATRLLW
ncbi:hypothetical protein [Massilia aquatica]|uniref:Uncharacterized protein n=1 Tax=Massilia aquatica TaxID=2609000 RepID=A0ABX0M1H2_9BURK|nr:hypothetical protein [Massilia aquatica]NHZ40104.1 hypothetical protein [Massilia aquatica]